VDGGQENVPQVIMTNKMTFSQGKMGILCHLLYLWSILASNPNNPKEEGRELPKRRDVPAKGTVVGGHRQQK
jgi:hypothetical protein